MKKFISLLLVNCLFSNILVAECTKPVQYIQEGAAAQCSGFLFSPAKELELRLLKEDFKLLNLELEILKHKNDLYSKQLELSDQILEKQVQKTDLWQTRAVDITTKYTTLESKKSSRDYTFFGLGILTTILTGWMIGQIHK